MTFAKRMTSGAVVVLLLVLAVLLLRAEGELRERLQADVAETLEREARLVAAALDSSPATWQRDARRFAAASGNRVTIVDRRGVVVADSDVQGDRLPAVENHGGRAEVLGALTEGRGQALRHSATVDRDLMYVAVPGGPGVVRVAEDLERVNTVIHGTRMAVLRAAVFALVVGILVTQFAARSVARPLVALAGSARAIASGMQPRFPRSGIAEIDALVQALRDMHRQLAERFDELSGEQAESAALVESMVEGVIAADARGTVTTANAAARQLLGYAHDEPLPDVAELFRARPAREVVAAALAGEPEQSRTVELDDRTMLLTARALPGGGVVLVLHDMTEVRRLEAVRRDFVANVSHELKTPLTSIAGYAETLLADAPEPDTARRFQEIILGNARRMHRLVDDLLDLSRIESGRWQPSPEPLQPAALVRDVFATFDERAASRGVALVADADAGTTLHGDADAVRQVLTNLVDNALRYTPAGGAVTVAVRRAAGGTELMVRDTGAGIAREHLPRIFERFYRADPSRSREEGGTGLGLSIVRHLVEGHGGRVAADSALGEGTTVTCWFPEADAAA